MTLGIAMMAAGLLLMFVGCFVFISIWYNTAIQIEISRDQGEKPEPVDQQTLAQQDDSQNRAVFVFCLGFVISIAGVIVAHI